jgi:hypothetical protein
MSERQRKRDAHWSAADDRQIRLKGSTRRNSAGVYKATQYRSFALSRSAWTTLGNGSDFVLSDLSPNGKPSCKYAVGTEALSPGDRMMRIAIVILPLLLAGCGLFDDGSWTSSDFPPDTGVASAAPAPTPTQVAPVSLRGQSIPLDYPDCRNVASERAHDAANGGYDETTQQYVYDHVYADCAAWRAHDVR